MVESKTVGYIIAGVAGIGAAALVYYALTAQAKPGEDKVWCEKEKKMIPQNEWTDTRCGQASGKYVPMNPTGVTCKINSAKTKTTLNWLAPYTDGNSPITGYNLYYRYEKDDGSMSDLIKIGSTNSKTLNYVWVKPGNVDLSTITGLYVSAVNAIGESQKAASSNCTRE